MANGNVELCIQLAAIIVALTAAFGGAYFGAKKSHDLEVQRRQKEEVEKVNDFKGGVLRQLKWYASVLPIEEIDEEKDRLENFLISLRFGDASALYYKIPKEERKGIDSVLDLLLSKDYGDAKDKIESLINQ